ncbi:MAG: RNA polymerase sigma factor [Pseudomonadota bacterium]
MTADPREEIVEHIGPMRAFALSLTRNSAMADDMVQDALVRAWAKIDTFTPGTNMRAWLFTILRNNYYSVHRKRGREVADTEGELSAKLATKPSHDGRLQMRDFATAFAELPDEQREALVLVGAGGFSYDEAAETCGVAPGTIKSRVSRGRARLIAELGLGEDDALELTDVVTQGIVSNNQQIA